ncbi:unnamed protein product [Linum tenue]|uniref:Uncharacterized protein n=1 Tax=Linum tenue TaxID=586396 RepID=A0AAV0P2G4_9ROSI|nr:unnamed protein product [Linum tenue]
MLPSVDLMHSRIDIKVIISQHMDNASVGLCLVNNATLLVIFFEYFNWWLC